MAYVAAEVRNPEKNILHALVFGACAVTLIYMVISFAFVHALGFEAVKNSNGVAADLLSKVLGDFGGRAISLLICISALGVVNGMIFTSARIAYAFGREHHSFRWLGIWNSQSGTPIWSLLAQAGVTLALIFGFRLTPNGFESMVNFTTPVFWFFFLLVGISVFVLRWRDPQMIRPYRVPLYPIPPILFCISSLFMLYSSITWAYDHKTFEALWSIGILALGFVWCLFERNHKNLATQSKSSKL
jgi:basic amino acid/polyamine antiporter, APA family